MKKTDQTENRGGAPAMGGAQPGSAGQYGIWSQGEILEAYRRKGIGDFFVTDQYFLSRISRDVKSVLDVGCAVGRLLEALDQFGFQSRYLGIDIVPENIELARRTYPAQEFLVADAVNFQPKNKFDLVYSAGTLFHIPEFERVINNMLAWSDRYVGFEVKFGPVAEHLIDIERCYSKFGSERAYMIPLNLWKFLDWLTKQAGIGRIQIFGYRTPVNRMTVVPPEISHFVSCCVFIEKGTHLHEVALDIPFAELQSR
ncbi:MAG TPA: class I SAM-dependent methyltransferase [Dongiaceae bacterium]